MALFSNTLIPSDSEQKLCVFGLGVLALQCYDQICLALGRSPDYFCDNDSSKWGNHYFNVICISPEQLSGLDGDIVVVISVRGYEAIYEQLLSLKIKNIFLCNFERGLNHISAVYELPIAQDNLPLDNSPISVKGRWALVTGASRGIGFKVSEALAGLGVNIVAVSRQVKNNDAIIRRCQEIGVESLSLGADLADKNQIQRLISQLPDIDILFNCAGVSMVCKDFWQVSADEYMQTLAVNTVAPILLCNHVIPTMIKRGFGRIVNVSSSIQYRPYEGAYACSKAALDKYVYDIAPNIERSGVKISLLDPGWLKTDMGGDNAPHEVGSVLPGALLGIVMADFENGKWFSAQDYTGYDITAAIKKAQQLALKPSLLA